MANEKAFDVRILERNLDKGLITREEYEKHLSGLDDVAGNATKLEAEFVEGVFDKDDDASASDDSASSEEE